MTSLSPPHLSHSHQLNRALVVNLGSLRSPNALLPRGKADPPTWQGLAELGLLESPWQSLSPGLPTV